MFAFDRAGGSFLRAGSLAVAVSNAGATVSAGRMLIVGETTGSTPSASAQVVRANRNFGVAGSPGAGSPFYGSKLLVADRGNDRLLLIDDTGKVTWTYPSPNAPPPPGGFYFPDDAFFIRHGTAIISNQEENDTIVEIGFPSGRDPIFLRSPANPGGGPGLPEQPRRCLPAPQRRHHRRGPDELPGPCAGSRDQDCPRPDRHARQLHSRPA